MPSSSPFIIAIVSILVTVSVSQKCEAPQKGIYMSYNTLSKRDTLTNLFK